MSRIPAPFIPADPRPLLPCPTSPTQQTESESYEHSRDAQPWDSYRNDHITDRAMNDHDADNTKK